MKRLSYESMKKITSLGYKTYLEDKDNLFYITNKEICSKDICTMDFYEAQALVEEKDIMVAATYYDVWQWLYSNKKITIDIIKGPLYWISIINNTSKKMTKIFKSGNSIECALQKAVDYIINEIL